ncbi:beta-calactosidase, putative [Talaromyces stipitatus ATCC 10500]|uniref:Beta-galactosidase n=1 Tax=Talaromyces stipitatus (strain ATCC 10500 / CBS 375.48 / QM 6759 / NRRL 1006) TaxID=441959 RepID=B8MPA3_TALSN|nr:beta-calactosidase, putative [Talaromyces stipitatus ATCC 10500]EED14342.1 beta-calactosidase, putative [Talaromyces stipitatus ATCC 10500]
MKLSTSLITLIATVQAQQTAWGQCGGTGWTGPTACVSGWTCNYVNPYYSQCIEGQSTSSSPSTTSTPSTTTSPVSSSSSSSSSAIPFSYNSKSFLLNNQPFQIIGGQMDPQRIPRAYWRQRLQMARAMGLNTVFSYVYWHSLEPSQGVFDFTGNNDLITWFQTVQEVGLKAVLRAGPYPFLTAASSYMQRLAQELHDQQTTQGGPIIMVQVENEYGNYGSDHSYTQVIGNIFKQNWQVTLYTNDGGNQGALSGGQIPGILAEIDGNPQGGFAARNQYVTDQSSLGPLLDGEYYVTWFDTWGPHSGYSTDEGNQGAINGVINDLSWILSNNDSFSIYMFHGGTSFGYGNGGENYGNLTPFITSYDYGAPLDESGRITPIYNDIRNMISNHVPSGTIPSVPSVPTMWSMPTTTLQPVARLFDQLPSATNSSLPQTMEQLGQSFGYVLYSHQATSSISGAVKSGDHARDRVIVYKNGVKQGVIDSIYSHPATVNVQLSSGDTLWLLVENLGRVDYGSPIVDQRKGIVGNVTIGGSVISNWEIYSYPLNTPPSTVDTSNSSISIPSGSQPVFYKGSFVAPSSDSASDTYLTLPGGIKGVVWVNGNNLGRYWIIGPQQSLYLPGCFMKTGSNEIVVLELEPQAGTRVAYGVTSRTWGNNPDPDCNNCS